ncbi:hypothetical protein FKP32DRAFT_1681068 [Trametes sanguinea]|nr:hypothetical protein FKP32DRAFT_1681068 [Trametes sanguinea]
MLSSSRRYDTPLDNSSADLLAKPSRRPVKFYDSYSALRLHDATGRVIWFEHHVYVIRSAAFSDDCTRAVVGNEAGGVFLYYLTKVIPPDNSAVPRCPSVLAVPEYRFSTGSTRPVVHVGFAHNGQGILTEKSYTPLSPDLRPLSSVHGAAPSLLPPHFIDDDGWLWHVVTKQNPHRICWLPPSFRLTGKELARTWSSQQGHGIAGRSQEGRLVIIDTSRC